MPLFHRQYQLNSPRLGVVDLLWFQLRLVSIYNSTSSAWAGRIARMRETVHAIHATHKQTGLHTSVSTSVMVHGVLLRADPALFNNQSLLLTER